MVVRRGAYVMTTAAKKAKVPILAAGLGLAALLAIALGLRYWPNPSNDEATRAASNISRQCSGGQRLENISRIESGLSAYLTKASAGTTVTSQDVGVVTSMLKPNGVSLDIYKAYTRCLKDQTEAYLKLKGVSVLPQETVSTVVDPKSTPISTPATSDSDKRGAHPEPKKVDMPAGTRPRTVPVTQAGTAVSTNQSGGITAGQIGELNIESKP